MSTMPKGLFAVRIWFWDDYVAFLNAHPDLRRWYYSEVLNFQSPRDQDRLILQMVATAFHRPALTDPLNIEQADDLVDALKDTQAALRTGTLLDRQTGKVLRQAVGGWRYLDDKDWQDRARAIDADLDEVRRNLLSGLADGRLERHGGLLVIRDPKLADELEWGAEAAFRASTTCWSWPRYRRSDLH